MLLARSKEFALNLSSSTSILLVRYPDSFASPRDFPSSGAVEISRLRFTSLEMTDGVVDGQEIPQNQLETLLVVSYPGINNTVDYVDDQIHREEAHSDEHNGCLYDTMVLVEYAVHEKPSNARPAEDRLDYHGSTQ